MIIHAIVPAVLRARESARHRRRPMDLADRSRAARPGQRALLRAAARTAGHRDESTGQPDPATGPRGPARRPPHAASGARARRPHRRRWVDPATGDAVRLAIAVCRPAVHRYHYDTIRPWELRDGECAGPRS